MILRGNSEKYKYLGKNETKNENILILRSVAQAGPNDEITSGRRSRWTVPLRIRIQTSKKSDPDKSRPDPQHCWSHRTMRQFFLLAPLTRGREKLRKCQALISDRYVTVYFVYIVQWNRFCINTTTKRPSTIARWQKKYWKKISNNLSKFFWMWIWFNYKKYFLFKPLKQKLI